MSEKKKTSRELLHARGGKVNKKKFKKKIVDLVMDAVDAERKRLGLPPLE